MWKRSAAAVVLCGGLSLAALLGPPAAAQVPQRGLPPGLMQEKARTACLGCHTAGIITQQQLDRRVWTKEIDKMIRWGAPVNPEDREDMIDYFAQNFGPREPEPPAAALPVGPGADKVRAACLGCHDAGIMAEQQLDRRSWARVLDKMIRWGAVVRAEDREAILDYFTTNFSAPAKAEKKQEKPQ